MLHLKYRPDSLEAFQGNGALKEYLSNVTDWPHSMLFHGPTGCGKTTLARIIATRLGCKGNDLREVDSADFRGIDTIREIRKQAQFRPLEGPCRVWILDEAHKMSNDAQNALLKILEDTPSHVYFIICTTDPQKLINTIRGRCSQHQVSPLSDGEMFKLLRSIVKEEGKSLQKAVYEQIIQDGMGLPRHTLQTLYQVLNVPEDKRLEVAKKAAEEQSQSIELCRALLGRTGWKKVAEILTGLKDQDAESIRRHVLGYCNSILLKGDNPQAAVVMEAFEEPTYPMGWPAVTLACYRAVNQ